MNISDTENKSLSSFDKSHSAEIFFKKPDKYREIEKLSKFNGNIITAGSNLSYSPLSFCKNSLSLNLKKFDRIVDFNLEKKEITVEAGITLAKFLNFTLKYNLWIPQLPGYPLITLGGAVATNAHGKSCGNDGTIRNSVKNILIFHNKNGWLNLSENENKDIFNLTIGGIGLTGSIVNITLKLENLNNHTFITNKQKVSSIKECVEIIKNKSKKKNSFIYSWNMAGNINELGKGYVFENLLNTDYFEKSKKIPEKKKINIFKPNFSIWNKPSIKLFNEVFYLINSHTSNNQREDFTKVIFPFYGKESYFDFFGKKGFYESQLLISEDFIEEFFNEFKILFKLHNPTISLFSFKNMSGEQRLLRFEANKICLTFDYINNKKNISFMKEIDNVCEKLGVIPSIIKDSRLSRTTIEKCYPELEKFKNELNSFDKKRIYKSETSERLGL